jgi:hypothetical protein
MAKQKKFQIPVIDMNKLDSTSPMIKQGRSLKKKKKNA